MESTWHFGADKLNWSPGHQGKGNLYQDGCVTTWNLTPDAAEHKEQADEDGTKPVFLFFIQPDGGVNDGGIGFHNQSTMSEDSAVELACSVDAQLYDARGQITEPQPERWTDEYGGFGHGPALLDHFGGVSIEPGSEHWTQMMNPGVPCPQCNSDQTYIVGPNTMRCPTCTRNSPLPDLRDFLHTEHTPRYKYDDYFTSKWVTATEELDGVEQPQGDPVEELRSWLDGFGAPSTYVTTQPTPHHDSVLDMMPESAPAASEGAHIDPPAHPYKPYDWAADA